MWNGISSRSMIFEVVPNKAIKGAQLMLNLLLSGLFGRLCNNELGHHDLVQKLSWSCTKRRRERAEDEVNNPVEKDLHEPGITRIVQHQAKIF